MQFFKKFVVVLVACGALFFARASFAVTYVCADTTLGSFCMEMLEEDAPATVANFLNYVRDGDFDKTFFHLAVSNSIVHGGTFKLDPLAEEIPADPEVPNEFKLSNVRGTVAMAKLDGQPNSATNEWFVNLGDNSGTLDTANGGSTVFAKVVFGLSVVDAIGSSPRVDLSASLGGIFTQVPVTKVDTTGVGVEDLMQLYRVYITDTLPQDPAIPYACTADWVAEIAPARVCMDTPLGSFCIDLRPDVAPLTVANFLHYVADGDYNSSFFHRSVKDFVVQAGALRLNPSPLFSQVPLDPAVVNEFSISNTRGTVAMAKLGDNPNSATSQWFVNTKDNSSQLDTNNGGFTVFGQIDEQGMAVIDQIAAQPIWNFSNLGGLGELLAELPLLRDNVAGDLNTGDFVKIINAYIPDVGPNPCFPVKPATLTEFANNKFEVPVRIGAEMYLISFARELNIQGFVFQVELNKFRSMIDQGQEAAVYTPADGLLVIPSILVDGSDVITNVRFRLTELATLQFTLESYNP